MVRDDSLYVRVFEEYGGFVRSHSVGFTGWQKCVRDINEAHPSPHCLSFPVDKDKITTLRYRHMVIHP
jgi:hypothetical protein